MAARISKFILPLFLLMVAVVAGVSSAYFFNSRNNRILGHKALAQLSQQLESTRIEPLIAAGRKLSGHPAVIATVTGENSVNNKGVVALLTTAKFILSSSLVYLLDTKGNTIACTPYANGTKTLIGKNYAFRPYFTKPMATGQWYSYIALGVTTGKRGLYLATPIFKDKQVVGIVVIKTSLDAIDQSLASGPYPSALISDDGVIISASYSSWLYKTGYNIPSRVKEHLFKSKQFAGKVLRPLHINLANDETTLKGRKYLIFWQSLTLPNWNTVLLFPAISPTLGNILKYITAFLAFITMVFTIIMARQARRRSIQARQLIDERYHSILDNSSVGFFKLDSAEKLRMASPSFVKLWGGESDDEIIGKDIRFFLKSPEEWQRSLEILNENDRLQDHEVAVLRKDGSVMHVLFNVSCSHDHKGHKGHERGIEGFIYDVSSKKQMETTMRLMGKAMESVANSIVITDIDGSITWVNSSFTQMTGYSADEVLGKNTRILKSGFHDDLFYLEMWKTISQGDVWRGEIKNKRKGGLLFYDEEMSITPVLDDQGVITNYIAINSDISDRKKAESDLEHYLRNEIIISEIAKDLLGGKITPSEFKVVLERIRLATNSDRVVIFENFVAPADGKCMRLLYGAYDPDREHEQFKATFKHHIYNQESAWYKKIQARQSKTNQVVTDQITAPNFSETLLSVPFFQHGAWSGLLALDNIDQKKEWSKHDIAFISTIAEMLGSYFATIQNTEKLDRERQRAEASNAAKSLFLANMSHEIRTPMNAIIGMSHLALQTNLSNQQHKYIESVHLAANNLLRIINDILDFSTIEAGKLKIERRVFNLQDIVDQTIKMVREEAEKKGLLLEVEGDFPPFTLVGDAVRLGEVLLNLCHNAVKFTSQGRVCLQIFWTELRGGDILFVIEDTGIGIEPEFQDQLFQAFSLADDSTTRKHGGTGLGLSISAKLVALMGGEIQFESTVGKGTRFSFNLTFGIGSEISASRPASLAVLVSDENCLVGRKILLVEDNEFNQMLVQELLERRKADVTTANNGEEAVAFIKSREYDLVLMDLQMPVCGGLEATRKIRNMTGAYFKNIGIIALTANAMEADQQEAFEAGMNGYISKPFEPTEFYGEICRCLSVSGGAETAPHKNKEANKETLAVINRQSVDPAVLDTRLGLKRIMGNERAYRKMLDNFKQEFETTALSLQQSWQDDDIETTLRGLHTLKGAAGSVGGREVQRLAANLEIVLQKDQDNSQIKSHLKTLDTALKGLLAAISTYVEPYEETVESKPLNDLDSLKKLLEKFAPFMESGKINPCRDLARKLTDSTWPQDVQPNVDALWQSIDDYDLIKARSITDLLLRTIPEEDYNAN